MSQERDELRGEVKLFENQLNAVAVEKAALYKEFQSVMEQLSELKENLQVEQKEKEVSMELLRTIINVLLYNCSYYYLELLFRLQL